MSHWPPSVACLRVSKQSGAGPALWLPLFLLWPLWFAVLALFGLLLFVLAAATSSRALRATWAATHALHRVACELRGTRCEISGGRASFKLSLL